MPLTNAQTRDVESVLHGYTPLHKLRENGPMIVEGGDGVHITDSSGKTYIEALSGLWCAGLGFGNEELIEAATEQLRRLPYYHLFGGKGYEQATELAEKLKEMAPMPAARVFFTSSGSEANDTQVKLAWYYNNARGKPEKKKIISRQKAYHGVTLVAGSMTGLPYAHADFDLPFDFIKHTECPHHYRFSEDGETEEEFSARLAHMLQELIDREGADTIAAFIAEPVMGAGGVIIPPQSYFPAIQPVLEAADIMVIDDEVINGFGRTGNWWGAETVGMTPTTLSCAKQLTSAYAPLGAVVIPQEMADAFEEQSRKLGTFGHGFTYGGHPVSCAVAVKAIEIYERMNIVERVRGLAPIMASRLEKLAEHPLVGNARSVGLIGAVELMADKATRKAFDPKATVGAKCVAMLEKHGVVSRAIVDNVALCPPMVISEADLNDLFDRLEKALDDTEHWVASEGLRAAA